MKLEQSAPTAKSLDRLMPYPSQRCRRRAGQVDGQRRDPKRDTSTQLRLVAPVGGERRHQERHQAVPPRLATQQAYDKRDMGDQVQADRDAYQGEQGEVQAAANIAPFS